MIIVLAILGLFIALALHFQAMERAWQRADDEFWFRRPVEISGLRRRP